MIFYLGTDEPSWLWRDDIDVPLFVSHSRLRRLRTYRPATAPWALDSGGFSEVQTHGAQAFADGPEPYVEACYRYRDEIGNVAWMAPQDWMVEPWMVERTGLSVREHQDRTVQNLLDLRALAPDLPFVPVLQGWSLADYLVCVDLYRQAGLDLHVEPTVGVGSVCRRQHTDEILTVIEALAALDLRLHGFGVKTSGVGELVDSLASADSLAWSFTARRQQLRLPGCTHRAKTCAHCPRYALRWREAVLRRSAAPRQLALL